jgi:hypothetical protein
MALLGYASADCARDEWHRLSEGADVLRKRRADRLPTFSILEKPSKFRGVREVEIEFNGLTTLSRVLGEVV